MNRITRSFISCVRFTPTKYHCRYLKTSIVQRLRNESFVKKLNNKIANIERGQSYTGKILVGLGHSVVAGVAVAGIGGFAHYFLGIGKLRTYSYSEIPREVRGRIEATYLYFTGAVTISACVGKLCLQFLTKNPGVLTAISHNGVAFIAVVITTQHIMDKVISEVSYRHRFEWKHFLFVCKSGFVGMVIAPLILLGGFSMRRAAFLTAGLTGGLVIMGTNTYPYSLRSLREPLSYGNIVMLIAFLGYIFVGRRSAYGNILYRIFMHGGVALYSTAILYNSSHLVESAVYEPMIIPNYYDPIDHSMPFFMDTANIYGRLIFLVPH